MLPRYLCTSETVVLAPPRMPASENGRTHTSWRLVKSIPVGGRVRQETVAQLGELDAPGLAKASALAKHFLGEQSESATPVAPPDRSPTLARQGRHSVRGSGSESPGARESPRAASEIHRFLSFRSPPP